MPTMKNLITALTVTFVLATAPSVLATTVECTTSQYGGAVCGVTTDEVTVTHETVGAGIGDWQLTSVIMVLGLSATIATGLYKLSYRWYILD